MNATQRPAGTNNAPAVPDPLDLNQATEEAVANYIIELQQSKSQRNVILPKLIGSAADAKRDLDVCKSQIKYLEESTKAAQSILRSLKP